MGLTSHTITARKTVPEKIWACFLVANDCHGIFGGINSFFVTYSFF
jgi:hypothetical protein